MEFKLYHYWRSSCSWRVRWALELKKVPYQKIAINLLSGDQRSAAQLERNPIGHIPTIEIEPGFHLSESLAIIEWLEERFPEPSLLPRDPKTRAVVREVSHMIAGGIQPLQNLKVLAAVADTAEGRNAWAKKWIEDGLTAVEKRLAPFAGSYSFGGQITMADLCLIPQVYNAYRYGVDMPSKPTLKRIYDTCMKTAECKRSAPENQPDAPAT
jgi:maleylacetoacetate isomerase